MKRLWWVLPLLSLSLLLSAGIVADAQTETCSALVKTAIDIANENCASLERNEVCYGYRSISASFYQQIDPSVFSEPTDVVPLTDIQSLVTLPVDPDTSEVGVALMKIQAMLPNTLPGQSVLFVMIGDVQVESAVTPDAMATPADPVDVTVLKETALRSGAGDTYNSIATVSADTVLTADGTSEDAEWVRIILDEYPLWVARDALQATDELDDLPAITGASYGAMQAFTLTSGIGATTCEEAPAILMVQGPQTAEITLNVNGVDVAIGSTVVFEAATPDELEVSVLDGSARVSDNQVVLGGFKARIERPIVLGESAERETEAPLLSESEWQPTEALEEADIARFDRLEGLSAQVLNYEVQAPRLEQIQKQVETGGLDRQNNFSQQDESALLNFERNVRAGLQTLESPGVVVPSVDFGTERDRLNRTEPLLPRSGDEANSNNNGALNRLPDTREEPSSPPSGTERQEQPKETPPDNQNNGTRDEAAANTDAPPDERPPADDADASAVEQRDPDGEADNEVELPSTGSGADENPPPSDTNTDTRDESAPPNDDENEGENSSSRNDDSGSRDEPDEPDQPEPRN